RIGLSLGKAPAGPDGIRPNHPPARSVPSLERHHAAAIAAPAQGRGMSRRRILLIEDEESIAEPLGAALEREGFGPVVAGTAAEGLEALRTRSPELVLLDVMLPDGDGRDVLREIRSTSRVPVIMLTARAEEMDRVIGLELGADDYVTK